MKKVKKKARYDLSGSIILLHGPPKIGKSLTAASFPKPLFIATEPGHKYMPKHCLKPVIVRSWNKFKSLKAIIDKKEPKTVVFDTISGAYKLCKIAMCEERNVKHPSEAGKFGRTIWDIIGDSFARDIGDIVEHCYGLGITVIFVDHTKEEEISTNTETITKVMCAMPGQARRFVTPFPDHIWFMGYGEPDDKGDDPDELIKNFSDDRVLWLRGGNIVEAGTRDRSMKLKRICPFKEADYDKKTGGYFQIIKEMTNG